MDKKFVLGMVVLTLLGCFVILALGGTHDPWDGSKWDITSPDIDQPHGNAYKELYDLRKGIAIRMNREHVTLATSSAGGWHLNGSAVCYEGTTAEPNLPDDSAALSDIARDRGRLWLDDNFDPPVLKRWRDSTWEVLGRYLVDANSLALYLHNEVDEDTENGRESQIRAYGEQSGGEQATLGYIEFSHDGTSDDQKGRIRFVVNDGNDANTPSKIALVLQNDGAIDVGDSVSVLDEDDMASDSATQLATQQSIKAYVDSNTTDVTETDVSGVSWFLDEDDMASDDPNKVASQQSIKAYQDNVVGHDGDGYRYCDVNGVSTQIYTKYLIGTLDADDSTSVAHGVTAANILAVDIIAYNDNTSTYFAEGMYESATANSAFVVAYDATNVIIGSVGTYIQGNAYRIKIDYY